MSRTDVSVIIVSYNVKLFLEQCLHAVQVSLIGMNAEIVVVDNNSTDGSKEYLPPKFPDVDFIWNRENVGFSKANNQAIARCTSEYILLLNPDTVVGEGTLRTLCCFMDDHPKAGGAGVNMVEGHGRFLPESKRSFPSPWVSFCKLSGLSRLFPLSPRLAAYSLLYLNREREHQVEVLSGAFMFLRREALDKVGLLDEQFFMYGEDIDLSYRLILGGYDNYYLPERILHYKGESTKHADPKYIKAFYGAMLIFFKKHYPNSSPLMQLPVKGAVLLNAILAAPFRLLKQKKRTAKPRRLMVICHTDTLPEAKKLFFEQVGEAELVNLWDLNSNRLMNAINRNNARKGFTDFLFCYPDLRFEQMLLFMDRYPDKKATYHIYIKHSGRVISPGK